MLRNLKLKWGQVASRQSGQVVATVWHYKRNLVSLWTLRSQPDAMTTVERRQPNGNKIDLMSTRDTSSQTITSSVWNITSMYILVPVWCIYILSLFVPSTAHSSPSSSSASNYNYHTKKRASRPNKLFATIKWHLHQQAIRCFLTMRHHHHHRQRRPIPSYSCSQRCVYCQQYCVPSRQRESMHILLLQGLH